jgi:hypothetical protein
MTAAELSLIAAAFGPETPRGKLCAQLAEEMRRRARENEQACLEWLDKEEP